MALQSEEAKSTTVSVCVPALNAEPFLAATIESVLAQTYPAWELIVVDNASTDRTGEVARSYDDPRIRVVTNDTTLSMVDNWNKAVSLADTTYVKLLCADDLIDPQCLAEQMAVVEEYPDAALVAGRRHVIDGEGRVVLRDRGLVGIIGPHSGPAVLQRLVASGTNIVGWPAAVLFKRDDFDAVGGFHANWPLLIDLELWTRLLPRGRFVGISSSLASFRVWGNSTSATADDLGAQHRALLRRVAADPEAGIGRAALVKGLMLSMVESVKRRLLFSVVNGDSSLLHRVPSLVVQPRRALARHRQTTTTRSDSASTSDTSSSDTSSSRTSSSS